MDIFLNALMSAIALIICLFLLWRVSMAKKDASIIDIFWGAGFGIVALVCLWRSEEVTPYIWLLAAMPIIWAIRLSVHLAARNLPKGEDKRYINMRKRAEKQGLTELDWRRRALFTIFFGQGFLIMIISAPIWVAMATGFDLVTMDDAANKIMAPENLGMVTMTKIGTLAILGALLWLIGFLFETIGDWQLSKFMAKMKDYDGPYEEKPVLDTGLWAWTRHPNYFGNACMFWGIYLVACQAPWGWVTIFAPIIMTLLLVKVSGKDLLERGMKKRKPYQDYIERTSSFFPLPPKKKS